MLRLAGRVHGHVADGLHTTKQLLRCCSTASQTVFQRGVKRRQRDWSGQQEDAADYDYLRDEVAYRLVDKLRDIRREFPRVLDLQVGGGSFVRALYEHAREGGTWDAGIQELVLMDSSHAQLQRGLASAKAWQAGDREAQAGSLASSQYSPQTDSSMDALDFDFDAPDEEPGAQPQVPANVQGPLAAASILPVLGDEEFLPFADDSFDLVVSNLNLQWVNDLPGTLRDVRRILKPDGMFLAALVGGDTLSELATSSAMADFDRRGGPLPHTSPTTRVSDVGGLLQAAGLALPTVDTEDIAIGYGSAAVLMEHLQRAGDSAAGMRGRSTLRQDAMLATAAAYHVEHSEEPWASVEQQLLAGRAADTSVVATFTIIYATGWCPHASQQKPKARGSATVHFSDIASDTKK